MVVVASSTVVVVVGGVVVVVGRVVVVVGWVVVVVGSVVVVGTVVEVEDVGEGRVVGGNGLVVEVVGWVVGVPGTLDVVEPLGAVVVGPESGLGVGIVVVGEGNVGNGLVRSGTVVFTGPIPSVVVVVGSSAGSTSAGWSPATVATV